METKNYYKVLMLLITAIILCNVNGYSQNTYSDNTYSDTYSDNYAAEDTRALPHLGLKAGVNFSTIYDTKAEDLNDTYKLGFAGGLFVSLPLGPYFGFQPELIYSKKGYKARGIISAADYRYTRNFDYLDLPLLLQIKPGENLTIVGGPFFSWLLNKRLIFNDGTISVEQQTEIKNSNIRKNTFGVTGGLDINLHPVVLSGRVGFDLRDNNGDGTSTDPRFKNAWIQATLGVVF